MTPDQHDRVLDLFGDLFEQTPAEWRVRLAEIGDPEVRAEVESLLGYVEPGGLPLDASISGVMQVASVSGAFDVGRIAAGSRFERYRIIAKLGQGGMGEVFEAVRDNDFHKRVALKIVRQGLDTPVARQRFQFERQTLAALEHPNIARLIDGGETGDGVPFLVLEYVDGKPIDEYCESCTQEEILRLFLKVCAGVEYAHRNLVIHRDLKPANILVTAEGEPKLLDFGIAKLLDTGMEATRTNLLALTPQYASPEQFVGAAITTASDVYSLGVVLYQLLTKRTPYEMDVTSASEVERIVCEQAPAPPALGDELDHILLMALRKEPERRYPGVPEFARDVERYLEGEAVKAMPDSLRYRVGKRVRRHWVGFTATAVVMASLAVGIGVANYQAYLAKQRFNQVRKLSNTFLFQFHDQIVDIPGTTQARAFVVKTALEYLDDLQKSAGSDQELQAELAQAYERVGDAQGKPRRPNLGDRAGAGKSYERAVALYEPLVKRNPKYALDAIISQEALAFYYINGSRYPDADNVLKRAFRLADTLKGKDTQETLAALNVLYQTAADLAEYQGDIPSDIANNRRALQYRMKWAALQPTSEASKVANQLATSHLRVGRALMRDTQLAEAEVELKLTFEEAERAVTLDPQSLRFRIIDAASALNLMGLYNSTQMPSLERPADAIVYARRSMALLKPLIDADKTDLPSRMNYLSGMLLLGRDMSLSTPGSGLTEVRDGLKLWNELSHGRMLSSQYQATALDIVRDAVGVLSRGGAHAEAQAAATDLVSDRRRALANTKPEEDDFWLLIADLQSAAQAAEAAGRRAEADQMLEEGLRRSLPFADAAPKFFQPAMMASSFYSALARQRSLEGRCAEAKVWQDKAHMTWQQLSGSNPYAAMRFQRAAPVVAGPCRLVSK